VLTFARPRYKFSGSVQVAVHLGTPDRSRKEVPRDIIAPEKEFRQRTVGIRYLNANATLLSTGTTCARMLQTRSHLLAMSLAERLPSPRIAALGEST
jgi:hypothetical protein